MAFNGNDTTTCSAEQEDCSNCRNLIDSNISLVLSKRLICGDVALT